MPLMCALCACVTRMERTYRPVALHRLEERGVEDAGVDQDGVPPAVRADEVGVGESRRWRKGRRTSRRRLQEVASFVLEERKSTTAAVRRVEARRA